MSKLGSILENQRLKYREVFNYAVSELDKKIIEIKPGNVKEDIFFDFPSESSGKQWQNAVLDFLENVVSKDVYQNFQKLLARRSNCHCNGCATCCKLACSEFSYEELTIKAQNGDNFAKQFTSIFIPYSSKDEVRKVYPEYIELLEENKEDDVYFYHCPKLTEDNRCSDYQNRPTICRDFPDNPLSLLPFTCGFKNWKEEVEDTTLLLHAMIEIVEYYKSKIPV